MAATRGATQPVLVTGGGAGRTARVQLLRRSGASGRHAQGARRARGRSASRRRAVAEQLGRYRD